MGGQYGRPHRHEAGKKRTSETTLNQTNRILDESSRILVSSLEVIMLVTARCQVTTKLITVPPLHFQPASGALLWLEVFSGRRAPAAAISFMGLFFWLLRCGWRQSLPALSFFWAGVRSGPNGHSFPLRRLFPTTRR